MNDANNRTPGSEEERGVMGSLPTTRPQRASARRTKARDNAKARSAATSSKGTPTPAKPSRPAKPGAAKPPGKPKPTPGKPKSTRKRAPGAAEPPRAPRQGFETESEVEPGKPVAPPNSAELAASVAELIGELAQTGLSSGGRLLRDALSRLPRG